MKITLQNSGRPLLIAFLLLMLGLGSKAQSFNFSITPATSTICTVGNNTNGTGNYYVNCVITSTVPGAGYYTFTVSPSSSIFVIQNGMPSYTVGVWCTSPGVHTVTGLAYASTSSSVLIATATNTFYAQPGPSVTVSGPGVLCPNSVNSFTASGSSSYTWNVYNGSTTYSVTGAVASLSIVSAANYSITSVAANGCSNTSTFNNALGGTVTVTNSSPTVCIGGTSTLSASGASSYTWSTLSNNSSIVVSPSVTTIYTLASTNSVCSSPVITTVVVAVATIPTLSISPNQTVCLGSPTQLYASGANAYVWSNSASGPTITVYPITSTCYSVTGYNATCSATAAVCVSVLPSPTVSIAGGGSVCAGSSITFTASGGNTYTWSTGANTATLNVIPVVSSMYTVTASQTLNSCTSNATVFTMVNQSCAIVWPGDANRDGVVNNTDVLELGLAASSTGPARTPTSIAWSGQMASAWLGTVSTGWNKAHADCNGDGIVNSSDNAAITANFSNTHAFKSPSSTGNDIKLVPQQSIANAGQWNAVDLMLGDATNNLTQLYGVAFDLGYDQSMVQTDSVKIVYTASFLKGSNQTIDFGKAIYANGKLYAATVRTDQTNVSGNGKIAELWFKLKSGIPDNSTINLSVSNAIKVSSAGITAVLNTAAPVSLAINNNEVGLAKHGALTKLTRCFPNPAQDKLILQSDVKGNTGYIITDITGRELMNGSFENVATIDLSGLLSNGTYLVKFTSASGSAVTKLVIAK